MPVFCDCLPFFRPDIFSFRAFFIAENHVFFSVVYKNIDINRFLQYNTNGIKKGGSLS